MACASAATRLADREGATADGRAAAATVDGRWDDGESDAYGRVGATSPVVSAAAGALGVDGGLE